MMVLSPLKGKVKVKMGYKLKKHWEHPSVFKEQDLPLKVEVLGEIIFFQSNLQRRT